MADAPAIAAIAADEFAKRHARAHELVRAGTVPAARAEAEVRAWEAIAVLAGAPVRLSEIEDYRSTIVHYDGDGSPARYGYQRPEAEARCDLARDLCGPNIWGPILSAARDAAIARADTPERRQRAANLCLLARALDVPLTPASCVLVPLSGRKAA